MSNYHALARHPITGDIRMADWLDDSFGHHIYGVRFPGDEAIYPSAQCNEVSLHEAGVEIERLRALSAEYLNLAERHMHEKRDALDEIERLRGALKHYSCDCTAAAQCPPTMLQDCDCGYVARAALAGEKTND